MINKAYELYSDILEKLAINTADCKDMIKEEETDKLLALLDQRSSLFSIYKTLYLKISQDLKPSNDFFDQSRMFLKRMDIFDQEALVFLQDEKTRTQIEIAKTFKNKETLKGYNLKSTK